MKSFEHKDKYKQEDWTNFETISKKKKLQNLSYKSFWKPANYKLLLGSNSKGYEKQLWLK